MTMSIAFRLVQRLIVILAFTWLMDFWVVQSLPDQYFDVGKQSEIVIALLLAWRYCMPLAPWKVATD